MCVCVGVGGGGGGGGWGGGRRRRGNEVGKAEILNSRTTDSRQRMKSCYSGLVQGLGKETV